MWSLSGREGEGLFQAPADAEGASILSGSEAPRPRFETRHAGVTRMLTMSALVPPAEGSWWDLNWRVRSDPGPSGRLSRHRQIFPRLPLAGPSLQFPEALKGDNWSPLRGSLWALRPGGRVRLHLKRR